MESLPGDPYERQLLEVFKSCDCDGKGLLNNDGLSRLCELLHLEDGRDELISCLLPNGSNATVPSISFIKFRDALLTLLGGVAKNTSREPSPDREVSPKYVYGQKKYGRRSRPESIEQLDCTISDEVTTNGDDNTKISSILLSNDNNVLICSSPELIAGEVPGPDTIHIDSGNENILINKECEDSGETELRNAWERLGVGRDGYLHPNELAMVCSAVGMDTMADQVVAQVFSTLKTDDEGRISFEEFLELFRSRSRVPSPQIVDHSTNQYTKLPHIMDLCDINGLSGARIFQDFQVTKAHLEAVTEERDKLRADLADANHRATLLAQEVDEHHAKIEKASRAEVELREQKHNEEIKELKRQMVLDKEQLLITNQKLEKSLAQHVEELSKLTTDYATLKKEFELLEKENQVLNSKLTESNLTKHEFQGQLECMEALHQRVLELESLNELSSNLKEKVNILQTENTQLRDKNDELTSQLEVLVIKSNQRREAYLAAFEYGGGTKRRGKSPELFNETRLGKVRRCCTETDLSNSHPHQIFLRSESLDNSDIAAEDESVSLSTSPILPQVISNQEGPDWEGNTYAEDIQKMKAQKAELEARIDHYQMKEWLMKTNLREGDSLNTYLSADSTQVTTASCDTSPGDDVTYSISPDRSFIDAALTEIGVQTESPVANLERHCHELESELERVREKIVTILTERRACSEENCALKLKLHKMLLKQSLLDASTNLEEMEKDEIDFATAIVPDYVDLNKSNVQSQRTERIDKEKMIKCLDSALNEIKPENISAHHKEQQTTEEFMEECLKCKTINEKHEEDNEAIKRLQDENEVIAKRCDELETSLELMRIEYEKTEDYWENKLEEERRIFEMDQQQSDEKFAELEVKIQEYAAELAAEEARRPVLPPIEEDYLEKQFTDLEDEYRNYKILQNHYRATVTKELAEKDAEIEQLKLSLETLQNSLNKDVKETEVQTNSLETTAKYASKYKHTTSTSKLTNPRLENIQIFHSLSNRLRQQEIRCRDLQSALKQQHKQTEQILHKAWERHKADLATIQNSLVVTQEKLNQHTKSTKQQLERLAMADGLVKDLVQENAHLAATVVSLEHRFQSLSQSALSNSI